MIEEVSRTLYSFFNSFVLPAYVTNFAYVTNANGTEYLPAVMPYITYDAPVGDTFATVPVGVKVWYPNKTLQTAMYKTVEKIRDRIKNGLQLPCGNGYLYICCGTPFAQPAADENPEISAFYLNIEITYDLN